MTNSSPSQKPDALDAYVEALTRCTGTLMLIADHMVVWEATVGGDGPPDESAPDTLRRLVKDVLSPALGDRPAADIAEAAGLLARTADVLGSDIFLIDPSDATAA